MTPIFELQNGFPGASYAAASVPLTAQKTNWQDPNQRTSYVQQASFGPQIQLSSKTVLEVDWVGNWGHKMNRLRNANQGVVTGLALPTQAIVQFPYAHLNTSTTAIAGAGTHAFLEYATNDGDTSYNALEVSLRRQISIGLGYQVSYTYSHNFSDYVDNLTGGATPQNAYNYSQERSNSPFDQTHRLVGSAEWKLPFGQGAMFLNGNSKVSRLLGNWQLNAIVTLATGTPFTVTAADNSQTGGYHAAYPNCTGNPFANTTSDRSQISNPNATGRYIGPAGFATPSIGSFGSCRPRMFHGPGSENADLSLFKQFPLTEVRKIELRF